MHKLTVKTLYDETHETLKLRLINGEYSFNKPIKEADLHRPGLALAGFVKVFTFQRVQVFGNTEMRYLDHLPAAERKKALNTVMQFDLPCIIVTEDNAIQDDFLEVARENRITIFSTPLSTMQLMHLLSDYMDIIFAPETSVHGSLVDVYGVGILFTGRSGIGKSEVALDLIERGHRLVADDVVNIFRQAGNVLMGHGTELLQYHMEIRGLGIIDVKSLFGINSVRAQKRIEVEVHLTEWDEKGDYERLGLVDDKKAYLGVEIPYLQLPIFPGKNITVIAEVIAMNHMLKVYGYNAAQQFSDRLLRKIQTRSASGGEQSSDRPATFETPDRKKLRNYLRKDYE